MKKELFVKAILAIKAQMEYDVKIAKKLVEAFPEVHYPNLLYNNEKLLNSLLEVLQEIMNDDENWIEYFCFDLDFGAENYILKPYDREKKEIPLSTPEELWEYLNKQKKQITMKKKELKKVYETFNNLNEKEQWEWLLTTNLKPFFEIGIDNDNTSIYFDCDKDADYLMYLKSDIGNREGALLLLEAIGCRASHV